MPQISSLEKIINDLKHEGLTFRDFSFTQEGNYIPSDADWNYKDVPHLHHIHQLVEAVITNVSDDYIATINVQKVLGIKFPLAVFNFVSGKDRQLYYANFFFYVLLIESSYEQLGPCRTRVTTRYCIGSKRFWMLFFPLIRWVLRRNYDDLMSGDIPMRERRGQLRKWGYKFAGDSNQYSYQKTMLIMERNVIPPVDMQSAADRVDLAKVLPSDGTFFWGREDHLGLRIVRENDLIRIFPRMCPHEGAGLDGSSCVGKKLQCPWHGRTFSPLSELKLGDSNPAESRTERYSFSLEKTGVLAITPLST